MLNRALFSSATDRWATPQDTYDALHAEFGFALDACASDDNAKCDCYFTERSNGLLQEWTGFGGAVWCNPPYGRTIGNWVAKAYKESVKGATVVMLLPARTDTRWFQDYVLPYAAEIRFLRGRLKFGGSKNSAPFPSVVVVFRPRDN